MSHLENLTIDRAHELLVSREVSCEELVNHYLARFEVVDSKVRAHITVLADSARARAREVDAKIARGEQIGRLEGIPYTVKDMFLAKGTPTTAASHMLERFVAPYNATVIDKLNTAGAILIAKVNQDEFAHGGSTENSGFHPTHNPWDEDRVPGGSSGGSAASIAAGLAVFSLGTDTGGSIRQPASFCGVVGLKPTYGLVSRYGVISMASSLDCIGPITRCVDDAATVLATIAGRDAHDTTTIKADSYDYSANSDKPRKIGIVKEFREGLDEENVHALDQAIEYMREAGHEVDEVSLPTIHSALPCYYILTPSEISSNLSRYDGVRYGYSDARATNLAETYFFSRGHGFGPEVKRRIMIGAYALSAGYYDAYYKKAMQVRTKIKQEFDEAFKNFDALVGLTTPTPAFKIGENIDDPITMYLADIMTVAANLAGVPAISVPAGTVNELPVGLHIMTNQKDEATLFELARAFEAQCLAIGAPQL